MWKGTQKIIFVAIKLNQCYATMECFKSKTNVKKWGKAIKSSTLCNQNKKENSMNKKTEAVKHHKLNVLVQQQETYWSNKKVSDFLSIVPFCYTGGQSNLKHGVTLQDLLQPIKNRLDLLQAQDPGLRLHQRLLIFLKHNSGRYEWVWSDWVLSHCWFN